MSRDAEEVKKQFTHFQHVAVAVTVTMSVTVVVMCVYVCVCSLAGMRSTRKSNTQSHSHTDTFPAKMKRKKENPPPTGILYKFKCTHLMNPMMDTARVRPKKIVTANSHWHIPHFASIAIFHVIQFYRLAQWELLSDSHNSLRGLFGIMLMTRSLPMRRIGLNFKFYICKCDTIGSVQC